MSNEIADGRRVVVVTGGASGFGRATALRFARGGAAVTIADVAANGDDVAAEIAVEAGGGSVRFARCDVSDAAEVASVVGAAHGAGGRLDVMVNNAGVLGGGWMHDDDADLHFHRHVAVNMVGVWNGCRAALALMRPARSGVIVNVASPAGMVPTPGAAAYGMTKAAVLHLTQSMAQGYGRDGVRINAVLPGPALTGIFQLDGAKRARLEASYISRVPLGRVADVDDIATAIEFLASDAASFITGAALNVDGGFRPSLPPAVIAR